MITYIIRVVAMLILLATLVAGMAVIFHFDAHPANLLILAIGFVGTLVALISIPEPRS